MYDIYIYVTDIYGAQAFATTDPLGEWRELSQCYPEDIGELTETREWVDDNNAVPAYKNEDGEIVFLALPYGWGIDEIDECGEYPNPEHIMNLLDYLT